MRTWRRLFGTIVSLAAFAYLCFLVARDFDQFREPLYSLTVVQFVGALCAAIAYLFLKATYHVLLSGRLAGRRRLAAEVLPAYFIAQVIRYLPGKIWGVAYQANRLATTLRPREVVGANTIQMVTTNLFATGVIIAILTAAYYESVWPLAGLLLTIWAIELVHRNPFMERWFMKVAARVAGHDVSGVSEIARLRWGGTLILAAEWVAYFAIWFAVTGGQLDTRSIIVLGTLYAAASLLAILAVAVPAGVAVREAIFVAISGTTGMESGLLVGFAAILRVILTVGELSCIPIALLTSRNLKKS